ncbi:MAG TPA: DUF1844 domain-containing protein [Pyrinomonadaceae bacterium]|nr:DUF1844 domain-containing protein [Pyrinomonadaceae bacterium]
MFRPTHENLSDEMSEEKPHFKVTDRRLFNPDGTPRDIERELEEPANENATATTAPHAEAATATTQTAAPSSEAEQRREPSPPSQPPPVETPRGSRASSAAADASGAAEDAAGDPTPFANLVMFIASPAAAAMGMTEHPGLAPGELDLPLAKHCIDLLGTIQQKTRGNLGTQEQQILEGLLSELRMQYISLTPTQRTSAPPRGFSGSDITGGR